MYQLSKYYRHGELDSCDGKWNDLWRALAIRRAKRENRTVDDIAAVDDARERSRNSPELAPMWKTAAPATAGKFWRKTFKENVPSEEEIRAARRAFDAENAENV
mmetsp:Transcript_6579/g.23931  ORF Transcript_6579/g.23931 Transcript_6579/m.23931 type:complete len:104 (+) Transcript_6579:2377-2688(+)